MNSNSEGTTNIAAHAGGLSPAGTARYVALLRIDVEPSGVSASRRFPSRRSDATASHRQLFGSLVKEHGAAIVSTGPRSVFVELGAPSMAISFATDAVRVLSTIGIESKAALHVGWVTWTGSQWIREGQQELQKAIDVARPGHIVATEQFRMLLHGDQRVWTPIEDLNLTSLPLYALEGRPAAGTGATVDTAIRRWSLRSLSRREREVAGLVAAGKSNREVASALHIAPSTVERHVSNVFGKLNVDSRVAVAVIAASGQL